MQAGRSASHAVNLVREVLQASEERPMLTDLDLAGSVENDEGVRALSHRNGTRPRLSPHRSEPWKRPLPSDENVTSLEAI